MQLYDYLMGEDDVQLPAELLILRACRLYSIGPEEAERVDHERLVYHLTAENLQGAISQSERRAASMSPEQIDLIGHMRILKRELKNDDKPSESGRIPETTGPTVEGNAAPDIVVGDVRQNS